MFVSRAATAVLLFGLLRLYLGQLQLSSCLECYVCISRNSTCLLIWIVTFVSCTTLSRATKACFLFRSLRFYLLLFQLFSFFLFGLLRLYLAQFKLSSYFDCYVCILHNLSCFLIWIVTFVSCANLAVFLLGLLLLYLSQFKLFSYLDRYVCISCYFSCFLIWIVTFVSRAI